MGGAGGGTLRGEPKLAPLNHRHEEIKKEERGERGGACDRVMHE